MCGIIGVIGKLPNKENFLKARDCMAHRGPDDCGDYYNQQENIALGHRRLAIIDLSSSGRQPFESNDKRYIIVFNGEIYNYLEIKEKLSRFYKFKTKTDTEVLLAAYIQWQEECLKYLNGMFAFAIWDKKEKKLFLARDRFGIKPLYYSQIKNNFYFSSEIKGILSINNKCTLNKKGLLDYLSYRYALGENTLFTGISSLLPGHFMFVKNGKIICKKAYWELPITEKKIDPGEKEALARTAELLGKSVSLHLRSDVPVGAYLSGGLDSSVLVAEMSKLSKNKIKTFSIGFEEEGYSELEYAKIVAKKFETDHHEYVLKGEEYFKLLQKVIRCKDTPLFSPNEVAWYALTGKLKKYVSVIMSGGGADELFGGYGRIFRSGYDLERMKILKSFSEKEISIFLDNLKKKYKDFSFSSPLDLFLSQYTYIDSELKQKLLNPDIFEAYKKDLFNKGYFKSYFLKLKKLNFSDQYLYIFQNVHLLGTLHSLDSVTMSSAVEARVPYVDYNLVEYISALPLKYKMAWKSKYNEEKARLLNSDQISEKHDNIKYLLKKVASQNLPEEIMNRKKMGFPVPLEKWFRGKHEQMAKDLLLSSGSRSKNLYNQKVVTDLLNHKKEAVKRNHGINIWMLVNIELWLREYNLVV